MSEKPTYEELEKRIGELEKAESKRKQVEDALKERVKELTFLHSLSSMVEKEKSLKEIIKGTVNLIPGSLQYPDVACARIIHEGREFKTRKFQETPRKLSARILAHGRHAGMIDAYYLNDLPGGKKRQFLKEERQLLRTVAGRLGKITERVRVEEDLKATHDKLIDANRKLELAYSKIRERKDRLSTYLRGESRGFLLDKTGRVTGITEKVLEATGMSRMNLIGSKMTDLVDKGSRQRLENDIRNGWKGLLTQTAFKRIGKRSLPHGFEAKIMLLNTEAEKFLLLLIRDSML